MEEPPYMFLGMLHAIPPPSSENGIQGPAPFQSHQNYLSKSSVVQQLALVTKNSKFPVSW